MITVHVDVVEPGRALVTGPEFSGQIGRAPDRPPSERFYVADTDTGAVVGHAYTYSKAARLLAAHHGHDLVKINLEYED